MRAFDAMRQSRKPVDYRRIQAIEYLDGALGADRRQLTKQFVENYDSSAKLAERIWQSIYDLSQGFVYAYQTVLEEALRQDGNARWKPLVPLLFARLTHYYGTDAKLRVFRYERWIPGKWMELHRTYLRACELGIDRTPTTLASAGPNATQWTVEQEYIFVLLIHQLNTGNMSPPQLDWAMAQLRAWSRRMQIDAVPRSLEGFFVDIAGKSGLGRRTGNDSGSMLRYLDTTPLAEQLERAIGALRQAENTDQGPAAPINQLRIAILEKVSPAISPNLNAELRRDPRIECAVVAKVRIGLSRICQELSHGTTGSSSAKAPRIPSRSRCTRSPAVRARATCRTSMTRWRRASRLSRTRCGRSRTEAWRDYASRRRAASANPWRSVRSWRSGNRMSLIGCLAWSGG